VEEEVAGLLIIAAVIFLNSSSSWRASGAPSFPDTKAASLTCEVECHFAKA
jgi:hypothetical protein